MTRPSRIRFLVVAAALTVLAAGCVDPDPDFGQSATATATGDGAGAESEADVAGESEEATADTTEAPATTEATTTTTEASTTTEAPPDDPLPTGSGCGGELTPGQSTVAFRFEGRERVYELFVPWARGDILAAAHREGEVLTETTEDDGMRLLARFEPASAKRLDEFVVRKVES